MMHVFDWPELVTDNLLAVISDASGLSNGSNSSWMTPYLSAIFEAQSDGIPLVEGDINTASIDRLSKRLFLSALHSVSTDFGFTRAREGLYYSDDDNSPFNRTALTFAQVSVNTGSYEELEALPVIGPGIAQQIVEQRINAGSFTSLDDLQTRVAGFGPKSAEALADILTFETLGNDELRSAELELAPLLQRLLLRIDSTDPHVRLRSLLDHLASSSNRSTPILPQVFNPLLTDEPLEFEEHDLDSVGVLTGANYYFRLQELIANANASVLVQMFHAALPNDTHPTKNILTALVDANSRGVDVRVILDQDRSTDPYKSTIINMAARIFFERPGCAMSLRYSRKAVTHQACRYR